MMRVSEGALIRLCSGNTGFQEFKNQHSYKKDVYKETQMPLKPIPTCTQKHEIPAHTSSPVQCTY